MSPYCIQYYLSPQTMHCLPCWGQFLLFCDHKTPWNKICPHADAKYSHDTTCWKKRLQNRLSSLHVDFIHSEVDDSIEKAVGRQGPIGAEDKQLVDRSLHYDWVWNGYHMRHPACVKYQTHNPDHFKEFNSLFNACIVWKVLFGRTLLKWGRMS